MRTWVAVGLGGVLGGEVGVAPAPLTYRSIESTRYRNLRVVHDGKLYRSGQLPPKTFEKVVRELGIGTVISFRDTKDHTGVHEDQAEADFCAANGVAFHRLPPADWTPVNGVIPGERTVVDFLRIMDDPRTQKRPVLVHCFAGIHRTGTHCAVYRMEYDGWTAAEAIAEMRGMGTPRTTFADNLIEYLNNYQPGRLRTSDRKTASVSVGQAAPASDQGLRR
jgi:tyrosine-protein phosphatase SIW14